MKRITKQGCGNEKTTKVSERVSEMRIGNTCFVVTSECSPTATETLEQKLMRIIGRHAHEADLSPAHKPL